MKFIGTKIDGKLVHPPAIAEEKRKHWESIPNGSMVESSFSVKRKDKTPNQLAAIWGLVMAQAVNQLEDLGHGTELIYNLPKPTGIPITKDDLISFFYSACPIYNEEGKHIGLSKSNTKEAAKFFEDVRSWMASQWYITIADPDPNWRTKCEAK